MFSSLTGLGAFFPASLTSLFLMQLEENIRVVSFSGDWVKLVDSCSVESSVTQSNTTAVGSTQKRGPGRRGRKPAVVHEPTADDDHNTQNDFIWWRGGMLSKLVFQKGILPSKMVKKSARQGSIQFSLSGL